MTLNCHKKRTHWIQHAPGLQVVSRLTLPMLPAVLALFLVDIFDSYLAAREGMQSVAALSLNQPITSLFFALSIGCSIALVCLLTRALGQHNSRYAREVASVGLLLGLGLSLVVGGTTYLLGARLLSWLGLPVEKCAVFLSEWWRGDQQALAYLNIRALGFFAGLLTMQCISVIRALGKTRLAALMINAWMLTTAGFCYVLSQGARVVVQVEPMGLLGLAWGHVLADVLFALFCLWWLYSREKLIGVPRGFYHRAQEYFALALPSMANHALSPFVIGVLTHLAAKSGTASLAAFGIATRLEPLILLLPMALTSSFSVFSGQNWAAGLYSRVRENALRTAQFLLVFQLVVAFILMLLAEYLATLGERYGLSGEWLLRYFYLLPLSYGALGITLLSLSTLSAIGEIRLALVFNVIRFLLVFIPCVLFGYYFWGDAGLYGGMFVGNVIAGIVAYQSLVNLDQQEKKIDIYLIDFVHFYAHSGFKISL